MVAAIVGVVILAAGAVAIGSSLGSDGDSGTVSDGVNEYRPVTVTGEALPQGANTESDPAVGQQVPVLVGKSHTGETVTLDPATDGKPTMVVFLAHWCPHCNSEVPVLNEWKDKGLVPEDLRIVGVTTASRSDQPNWPPSRWINRMDWTWEVMADSEQQTASASYGVDGYPFVTIVDGQGKVLTRWSGEKGLDTITQLVNTALGK
jgi:thiol-disulfide isomerase/thioredoxin